MGEEHCHLLSGLHRYVVLMGHGDITGNLAGVFVFFAGNRACTGVWAEVLIVLSIPLKVRPDPRSIVASGFIKDRNMRSDLAVYINATPTPYQ